MVSLPLPEFMVRCPATRLQTRKENFMKKLILAVLVVACALTISMGTSAQDAPKTHTMTGCLRAGTAPGTYYLSDLEKGPKTVGIVSSDANLAPHVGHKIYITVTSFPPSYGVALKGV